MGCSVQTQCVAGLNIGHAERESESVTRSEEVRPAMDMGGKIVRGLRAQKGEEGFDCFGKRR